MKRKNYDKVMAKLDQELVAMARWVKATGQRVVVVIEGRDTAGKGGVIDAIRAPINPRECHVVALGKPDKKYEVPEYFDRYAANLPGPGHIALFDRSWYNRAGVERVMKFCTEKQAKAFLAAVPAFEQGLIDQGILLFKYWLCCDQDQQEERFAERLADPLKQWKLSPIDIAARQKYDAYTVAREAMLKATHTAQAPWTLADFNDQKRGRLTVIRDLLDRLPDTKVDVPLPVFAPLDHSPSPETYAVVKPLAPWPAKSKD